MIYGGVDYSRLQPTRGPTSHDLSVQLDPQASIDIEKLVGTGWSALTVTVRVAYDAAATAGIRVYYLYSPDCINYDSEADAEAQGNYIDPVFAAGTTTQATFIMPLLTNCVKIRVKNKDAGAPAVIDIFTVPLR